MQKVENFAIYLHEFFCPKVDCSVACAMWHQHQSNVRVVCVHMTRFDQEPTRTRAATRSHVCVHSLTGGAILPGGSGLGRHGEVTSKTTGAQSAQKEKPILSQDYNLWDTIGDRRKIFWKVEARLADVRSGRANFFVHSTSYGWTSTAVHTYPWLAHTACFFWASFSMRVFCVCALVFVGML